MFLFQQFYIKTIKDKVYHTFIFNKVSQSNKQIKRIIIVQISSTDNIQLFYTFSLRDRTMQNMRSSRLRRSSVHSRQGSGVQTPQQNRQKLKQKEKLSEDIKAKYIQQLQERNRKLKYQIIKINQMLDEYKDSKAANKRQYKLIPNQSSADVLKKQLQNVYKLIKTYEHEINLLQTKHSGGLITDKMAKMQTIFKQKSRHLQKLKSQLNKLNKQSIDNSKKLKDNFSKQRMQNVILKYNDEIQILRERVRNAQDKQKKKQQNAKKQYEYIKKLERQLMQNGVPMDEIQELKKNNIYIQIFDKLNNPDRQQSTNIKSTNFPLTKNPQNNNNPKNQTKEQIQDMTIDRYNQLKNQVRLYQKLHQDYQKKLGNLDKEKINQDNFTQVARKKLEDKQMQVSVVQAEVGQLKAKIKSINLKSNYQAPVIQPPAKKQKPKMPATKLKKNAQQVKSFLNEQTHIKFDQKGSISQKGQRFTDRSIVGKVNNLKIIAVKIWTQKVTNSICGVQCLYRINDQVNKWGDQHINKDTKKHCTQNKMQLNDGDYIKTISGHLSSNNIIEYLVYISNQSSIGRFGVAKPTQKQFNFDIEDDQIPICMYGSMLMSPISIEGQKKEIALLEQLGFQITTDKAFAKDVV